MPKKKCTPTMRKVQELSKELPQRLQNDKHWAQLRRRLPQDLQGRAQRSGALKRKRKLQSGELLLRLALLFSFVGLSLRTLSAWAAAAGLVRMSDEALGYRLSRSVKFLQELLAFVLQPQRLGAAKEPEPQKHSLRLRFFDASDVTRPGKRSTDVRLHFSYDLLSGRFDAVHISGPEQGERLDVLPAEAGELLVADMGLGRASGLHAAAGLGAASLVRVHFNHIRLEQRAGVPIAIEPLLRRAALGMLSTTVWVPFYGHKPLRARLLICPLRPEAAARARQKRLADAARKGRNPSPLSLLLCGFLCVLTTLPTWVISDAQILELYRLRWQIELAFKRYKSLLGLDELRKTNEPLLQVQLLGRLIAIALVEQLLCPWSPSLGAVELDPLDGQSAKPPLSLWRLTHLASLAMDSILLGPPSWWEAWATDPPALELLRERPRTRRYAHQRLVTLRNTLNSKQVNDFLKKTG